MTWFRIDDSFADHPKVLALQSSKHWKGALALWTLAGAWCAKQLTDGEVPAPMILRLGGSALEATALVEAGLWRATPTGYAFHDWSDRNPLRSEVEARREATRQRVTHHRRNKSGNDPGNSVTVTHGNASPVPSRPVPRESALALVPDGEPESRSLVALGDTIRAGVVAGYESKKLPPPKETRSLTWPGWAELARWVRDKARLLERDEIDVAQQTVRSFLNHPRAERDGFPITFLVQNASEFWEDAA